MKKYLRIIVCLFWGISTYCQENDSSFISFSASYVGDVASNISGGIKQGTTYMGMIDLMLTADLKLAGLWKGGILYAHFENTHGGGLTEEFVGDIQTASNIENGNASYLYELWYMHTFSKGWVKAGKIDMNTDFLSCDFAGEYVNSSFGIMPTASSLPASIFPKNSTAICGGTDITNNLSLKLGVFDGDPLDLEQDRYSTNFEIGSDEGFMFIGETTYEYNNFIFRAGAYNHTADFSAIADSTYSTNINLGFYMINDFSLNENAQIFVKAGIQNSKLNEIDKFLGAGLNYTVTDNLLAGTAFATAFINAKLQDIIPEQKPQETVIECFAKYSLWESIHIQPEIQYIINPGALNARNALIALIRTTVEF